MSHIKKTGRPPKAGREWPTDHDPLATLTIHFTAQWGIAPSSRLLKWHVPFHEIVEGIQSVEGIAKLAGANVSGITRKTVYRRKIPLGGYQAFDFVLYSRSGTTRPLVTHSDPLHRLNLGHRLKTNRSWLPRGVLDVVDACQLYFTKRCVSGTVMMQPPVPGEPKDPVMEKEIAANKRKRENWKRKQKISIGLNPIWMSGDYLKEMQRKRRLGQTYLYEPPGRVTVKMLCSFFNVPRREFYRWKDGLLVSERKLLDAAMAGKLLIKLDEAGDDFWLLNQTVEFASDKELDESLGWKEPPSAAELS